MRFRFVLIVVVGLVAPVTRAGPIYSDLIVFGDSLSDNGNYYASTGGVAPLSPPYFHGRYSNGPVWVERLAGLLGLPTEGFSDHAVAGATTRDVLTRQVIPFVHGASVPTDALYVLWAGANDFLSLPSDPLAAANRAVANIDQAIRTLAHAGATDVVVPNLPNLGRTPAALEYGSPYVISLATTVSAAFNTALAADVPRWRANLGINVIELDTFHLLEQMVATPGMFGLTNVTQRALRANGTVVPNPDAYLFWDQIHPTASVHTVFADRAYAAIPEPTTLSLLTLTLLPLWVVGRGRFACGASRRNGGDGRPHHRQNPGPDCLGQVWPRSRNDGEIRVGPLQLRYAGRHAR